jgi:hypothetical protein
MKTFFILTAKLNDLIKIHLMPNLQQPQYSSNREVPKET